MKSKIYEKNKMARYTLVYTEKKRENTQKFGSYEKGLQMITRLIKSYPQIIQLLLADCETSNLSIQIICP